MEVRSSKGAYIFISSHITWHKKLFSTFIFTICLSHLSVARLEYCCKGNDDCVKGFHGGLNLNFELAMLSRLQDVVKGSKMIAVCIVVNEYLYE